MDLLQVKIDEKTIRDASRILRAVPGGVERAFPRAINRTQDAAAADLKRSVKRKLASVKSGEIGRAMLKRPRASRSSWYAALGVKFRRIPVATYTTARQTKKGVRIRSAKTNMLETIEHGFFATMPSGHRGVFVRAEHHKNKAGAMMKGKNKEAIFEKYGPSVYQVILNEKVMFRQSMDRALRKLSRYIDDQVGVELKRWAKR